jgi:hypothetical protein
LHEVDVGEGGEGLDVLDVLELVVAEVEGGEGCAGFEAVGVLDQVVVELEFDELRCERFGELDLLNAVLAEAQSAQVLEALEA